VKNNMGAGGSQRQANASTDSDASPCHEGAAAC
jgi:hypothetical protein